MNDIHSRVKITLLKTKTIQKVKKQKQNIYETSKNLKKKSLKNKNGGIPPFGGKRSYLGLSLHDCNFNHFVPNSKNT